MYGKDGEKMIPPVRIHGRKWDVEEWSMFKEIRDERAFNGILKSDYRETFRMAVSKRGDALPAERDNGGESWEYPDRQSEKL